MRGVHTTVGTTCRRNRDGLGNGNHTMPTLRTVGAPLHSNSLRHPNSSTCGSDFFIGTGSTAGPNVISTSYRRVLRHSRMCSNICNHTSVGFCTFGDGNGGNVTYKLGGLRGVHSNRPLNNGPHTRSSFTATSSSSFLTWKNSVVRAVVELVLSNLCYLITLYTNKFFITVVCASVGGSRQSRRVTQRQRRQRRRCRHGRVRSLQGWMIMGYNNKTLYLTIFSE